MKPRITLIGILRMLLVSAAGIGLGLLTWQWLITVNSSRGTAWISYLVEPIFPMLALAWVGSVIICCILLLRPQTRPTGIKGLTVTFAIWLFITLIAIGVYYAFGTANAPPFIEVVGGMAYLAAGLGFGFILAPLLIVRLVRLVIRKGIGFVLTSRLVDEVEPSCQDN